MTAKPSLNRRTLLKAGACAGAATIAAPLFAQSFPERQITLVVPAPPGGTADLTARWLMEPLSKALGQPVVVDNKGGGSGAVGAQAVLNAKPDGHSLLVSFSGFHVMSPHLVKLPYKPLEDLQPVANVISAPQLMVIRSTLPIQNAKELIEFAKKHPGKLNYSSAGNGSVQHIAAELFKSLTGTFVVHIPYRGTGPMVQDLLSGQVDMTLTTSPPLIPHINSGRMRPMLVASKTRLAALPNVPTGAEVGIKDFEVASWFALHTHKDAPRAAVNRVSEEVRKIISTDDFKKKAAEQGAEATYLNPEQMRAYERQEFERWGKVIKAGNIKAD
jgi:tripartite-type tricarboxylate transporter receptor subunit TctC